MIRICGLKVENMTSPMGIGASCPRFSWRSESDIADFVQKSYRIKLYEQDKCLWDSNVVESPESLNITGCPRLRACRQYSWQVTITDQNGNTCTSERAFFETGMLHKKWKALWIAGIHNGDVKQPVNYLRKGFELSKPVVSARLYSTALGVYECFLNGKKVSED